MKDGDKMTHDDILRFLRMAKGSAATWNGPGVWCEFDQLENFWKIAAVAEREINAQIAEVAYRQYKDTEKAHEKLSPEPFRPELYGFNTREILLSKEIAYEIRARSNND